MSAQTSYNQANFSTARIPNSAWGFKLLDGVRHQLAHKRISQALHVCSVRVCVCIRALALDLQLRSWVGQIEKFTHPPPLPRYSDEVQHTHSRIIGRARATQCSAPSLYFPRSFAATRSMSSVVRFALYLRDIGYTRNIENNWSLIVRAISVERACSTASLRAFFFCFVALPFWAEIVHHTLCATCCGHFMVGREGARKIA